MVLCMLIVMPWSARTSLTALRYVMFPVLWMSFSVIKFLLHKGLLDTSRFSRFSTQNTIARTQQTHRPYTSVCDTSVAIRPHLRMACVPCGLKVNTAKLADVVGLSLHPQRTPSLIPRDGSLFKDRSSAQPIGLQPALEAYYNC